MSILKCAGGRFSRAATLFFFTALLAWQALAQPTVALPPGVTRVQTVEGITQYQLANGLKVLLAPDLADERVTVNLTYLVGSRHEGYGESGMAHLLEHLIFKGSPNTIDPKAEFRKRGFTFNGTTSADRTNYYATFVSSQESLDWYIGWQADAMVNSFIAKKDLDSEMTVVRSEFEIAGNNPFATLSQRVMAAAYPWHNYGKPTIGNRADIENVDISRLQTFYKHYYRADNAVLMVAGKFDPAATLAAIQKSFGPLIKPPLPVTLTYTLEPVQDGERSVVVRRPASAQLMLVTYHAPAALHPDNMALAVLATALGDVPSGRLHKALVESKLAQAVFAGADRRREAGSVLFGTAFGPDDDPLVRQKLLLDTIENLATEPLRQDEFDRARAKIEKNLELAFANAAAVAQGALQFEVLGDWRAVFVDRERMKAVTLDDVNRVARSYLLTDNRTLGHLIPTKTPVRAPEIGLPDVAAYLQGYTLSEKGLESSAFDFSTRSLNEKVSFASTPGGIKAAMLSKPVRGDLVKLTVSFKFGSAESLRQQDVAAMLAAQMLDKGTASMTRQQIHDEQVRLGAALSLHFGDEGGALTLTVKQDKVKPALELATRLLRESTFPPAEFEEIRSAQIKAYEGQLKDKSAQAQNAWSRYGNPYAKGDPRYVSSLEETLQELKSVTRDQAYAFYQRFYGAQNAQIAVLGPIDVKQLQQQFALALDGWQAPQAWQRVEQPLVDRTPTRLVFDTPDKTNASLTAYHALPLRAGQFDWQDYAMSLATRIFGGGPGSRLWLRLRETSGLSYSAGASYSASRYEANARFSMSAEVSPGKVSAAESALKEELARSLGEGFSATEVETFRQQFLADRLRGRSGDGWALAFMGERLEFDQTPDAYERGDAMIASLTPDQVNSAWKKFVKPEKMVWGVFGDQSKMR